MGISESTVATQLSLAVKFMREQFIKHYDKLILILWAFLLTKCNNNGTVGQENGSNCIHI